MTKTVHRSLRIDEALDKELERIAAAENRSFSNLAETALWEFVKQRKAADKRK